jgi:hypothetical protein
VRAQTRRRGRDPGVVARADHRKVHGADDDRAGQRREGESPRETKTQESRDEDGPQRCGVDVPARRGEETPEARPYRAPSPERGDDHVVPSLIRDAGTSERRICVKPAMR